MIESKVTLETTKTEIFGYLDALDENDEVFESYFLETNIYRKVKGKERFLMVVGEKGTGKSALLRMCMISNEKNNEIVVNIRRPGIESGINISQAIERWKNYIAREMCKTLNEKREMITGNKTVNAIIGSIEDVLNGFAKEQYNVDYLKIKNSILDAYNKNNNIINIYIDDLDIGYKNTLEKNESIAALFTAIRDMMRENKALKVRMTLRTDVYDNVRRIDESSDKIQGAKVELKISNHEIFAMLTKRVCSFLGQCDIMNYESLDQNKMMDLMGDIIDPVFNGRGKWEGRHTNYVLMTMTRRRPRDIFSLCGFAWDHAVERNSIKIETEDLDAVMRQYSKEKMNDIVSEYRYEFRNQEDLKEVILALRPSTNERKRGEKLYVYDKSGLLKKIGTILERHNIYSSDGLRMNRVDLAKILYKANVITGRIDSDSSIERIYYMEEPDLISELNDKGCNYEVHPAYRWILNQGDDNFKYIDYEEARV